MGNVTGTGNWVDALQLLINASGSFPAIQLLIMTISALIGIFFVASSLMHMYSLSAANGASWNGQQPPPPVGVVGQFLIGGVLISSAYWMYIIGNTMVGTSVNTTAMLYGGNVTTYCDQAKYAVFFFVALVGQIAFVRGWILLNAHFNNPRTEGLGTGIAFLLGGAGCYFMADLTAMAADWFGVSVSISVFC
jgi:hypothetical protein